MRAIGQDPRHLLIPTFKGGDITVECPLTLVVDEEAHLGLEIDVIDLAVTLIEESPINLEVGEVTLGLQIIEENPLTLTAEVGS